MTTARLVDPPLEYDPQSVLAAEDMVRNFCGWHIAPSITETLTVDGNGSRTLILPTERVTAISAIVEDGTTLSVDSYSWSEMGLITRRYGRWIRRPRVVQVTLTHGYDTCPPAVRREVARLAAAGYAVPPVLSDDVRVALSSYQLPAIA